MSKFNAHEYRATKNRLMKSERDPNGYLYSYKDRITKTKIKKEDLPEYYIKLSSGGIDRYIDALNVKSLLYKPNYIFNHLYKDDFLYVSYDKPIIYNPDATIHTTYERTENVEIIIWGWDIVHFTEAVKEYTGFEVDHILDEMNAKKEWFEKDQENHQMNIKKHKEVYAGYNVIVNENRDKT